MVVSECRVVNRTGYVTMWKRWNTCVIWVQIGMLYIISSEALIPCAIKQPNSLYTARHWTRETSGRLDWADLLLRSVLIPYTVVGCDSSVGIATRYGLILARGEVLCWPQRHVKWEDVFLTFYVARPRRNTEEKIWKLCLFIEQLRY